MMDYIDRAVVGIELADVGVWFIEQEYWCLELALAWQAALPGQHLMKRAE